MRIKRDLFTGSSLGVIGVNKQGADGYNRAAGVDFIYRPTDKMNFRGLWARTFDPDTEDFEIREGIIIPKGEYSYNNYSLMLNAEGDVFNGRMGFNRWNP